jgi:hypothetical protein
MVHELHKQGYQRLRIMPGMSPSGIYWRVGITPVSNILRSNGARAREFFEQAAHYTSGAENEYFDWQDAHHDTARSLAAKFLSRFPRIAEAGLGRDWDYAGWYVEMLGGAEREEFPVAYSDYYVEPPAGRLPTTKEGVFLPAPPPGEADDQVET